MPSADPLGDLVRNQLRMQLYDFFHVTEEEYDITIVTYENRAAGDKRVVQITIKDNQ